VRKYTANMMTLIRNAENTNWSLMHLNINLRLINLFMKLAFVADTHFGYSRFENDARCQGEAALLDASKKADAILLGGDIFDQRVPRLDILADVASTLKAARQNLPERGFPKILAIHGTHEARSKNSMNPISLMERLGLLEDVHNRTVVLEKKKLPNQNPAQKNSTSSAEPACEKKEKNAGKSAEEYEKAAVSGMGGIPDDLVKQMLPRLSCKPVQGATNFFMFHQTLQEFVPQAKNVASIHDLPAGYDYYLCGHIHARKEYLEGKLLIPGSTVITQLKDEEQGQKGYYLIDTIAKTQEFIPIKTRPFIVHELKFENASPSQVRIQIEKELSSLLQKNSAEPPIIKLRLCGSLQKGGGEIDTTGFGEQGAFVTIDNQLEGNSLLDEIERIRGERLHRTTPVQLGMELLLENAKKASLEPKKAKEYFEKFSKEN